MRYWLYGVYLIMTTIDSTRTQNPFFIGSFSSDPFLETNNPLTTTALTKSAKTSSRCLSDADLAGAIIGTLILSSFAAFLAWLVYIRPKLQLLQKELLLASQRDFKSEQWPQKSIYSSRTSSLPLDATEYKFGTFPLRLSQVSQSSHSHHSRFDWPHRVSSSIRSVNQNQDSEMLDIELLDPSFGGLNFNITGSMRAGIFIKDMMDQDTKKEENRLQRGDRIMALTVCFESIVYEDALTILSYASPYPVILRVQRPIVKSSLDTIQETRSVTINQSSNRVKWRDEFDHYDNDSRSKYSFNAAAPLVTQPARPLPSDDKPTTTGLMASPAQTRIPSKRRSSQMNTEPRMNQKSSTPLINKNYRVRASSNGAITTIGSTVKRCTSDRKKYRPKAKPTHTVGMSLDRRIAQKTSATSVTGAIAKALERKDGVGQNEPKKDLDRQNHSEELITPYYDSPYGCLDDQTITQYQYLHPPELNKNNNNSLSMESLTLVTPYLNRSTHQQLDSYEKSSSSMIQQHDRPFSLPTVSTSSSSEPIDNGLCAMPLDRTDAFV